MYSLLARLRSAYTACGILSLFALSATLHVYRVLPALRNLHGRIVVGNVLAVLVTTLGLVLLYNARPQREGECFPISQFVSITGCRTE